MRFAQKQILPFVTGCLKFNFSFIKLVYSFFFCGDKRCGFRLINDAKKVPVEETKN